MNRGQITSTTKFGKLLSDLAEEASVIVEFGTHDGTGSTQCLYAGVRDASQHLYSVDIDGPLQESARAWFDSRFITFIHGTIVKPEEFQTFAHPDPDSRQFYIPERDANARAPYVFDQIPEKIDLLLLDGGEWTSEVEFRKLYKRSEVIAMDDSNARKSNKNWRARDALMVYGWTLVGEDMNERNGWSVFRRPE